MRFDKPKFMSKTRTSKNPDNPLEKDVQKAICEYLKLMGIVFSKTDASRTFSKDGIPRRSKVTPDWPDVSAVLPMKLEIAGKLQPIGIAFYIEVKRPKGSLIREGQKERLSQLRATGAIAIIARSVGDVKLVVDKYLNRCPSLLISDPLPKFAWELPIDSSKTVKSSDHAIICPVVSSATLSPIPDRVKHLVRERLAKRS